MGEFDVVVDFGDLLPKFDGKPLEWESLKGSWKSKESCPLLLSSVSLTLKAIKIELGNLTPSFKVDAEKFTHPIELIFNPVSDNSVLEKCCPLEADLPFIKADEMAAMSDVDGGKFVMTTSNLGPWSRKLIEDPEFADAGIPFSPYVIGYAKKMQLDLREVTISVEEGVDAAGSKTTTRCLGVRWTMGITLRPIFGEQKDFVPIKLHDIHSDLERWMNRVEEAKRLCAAEVMRSFKVFLCSNCES